LIEETYIPRNPLAVLAQQIVAICAMDDWSVDELTAVVHRCANFGELSDEVLTNILNLLSGAYPSEEFSELRPRIVWDRVTRSLRGRAGAQRLALTNAGTVLDCGLSGVFIREICNDEDSLSHLRDRHGLDDIIVSRLPDTAMLASRFRECSARALLLPRRRPGQRTPLWQQRQ
jgi:Lhr-like helicase